MTAQLPAIIHPGKVVWFAVNTEEAMREAAADILDWLDDVVPRVARARQVGSGQVQDRDQLSEVHRCTSGRFAVAVSS
jgi:hypothetical protein